MVTAEVTFSRDQLVHLTHPMEFVGIDWETYEEISEELGDSSSLHVTYNKGILTFMPVTELHELLIGLLHNFITFAGMSLRVNVVPTGAATMRSKRKLIGVEPDLSYFISKATVHHLKDYVPDELELAPDIVVEVDIHHRSNDKFEIYASLGVPEFWLYHDESLQIFKLNENRFYDEINESSELPVLSTKVLNTFIDRGRAGEEQFNLLIDFQEWLRTAK